MAEQKSALQGEIEKARIEVESLKQNNQQIAMENARLLERLGTLEEQQVSAQNFTSPAQTFEANGFIHSLP